MKENTIFIDNFYQQNLSIGLKMADNDESSKVITGLHPKVEQKEVKKSVISEIFKALLLHDKIVFRTNELLDIISAFGIDDTIKLIQTKRFEFIDDCGFTMVLGEKPDSNYSLSNIRFASPEGPVKNSLEWLEKRLYDDKTNNNKALNVLLLNAEKHNKYLDIKLAEEHIIKETQFDIKNGNISNYLNLTSNSTNEIGRKDAYNFLRLGNLNKTLIYSSILNIDNISMDGAIKPILGVKLSPRLNISPSVNLYDSIFKDIFEKKNIPDLATLYINNTITLDDYLQIVSTLSSRKFRHWIMDKDYNPSQLESDIIASQPKITNSITKFIKWSLPNAIGIFFPTAGLVASYADSYILEKIAGGWHPNLFMDDLLKQRIDSKVELHAKSERLESIKARFPNVGRNEICPCGSKIKFKKCCGK